MVIFKETQENNISKQVAVEKVRALLQEPTNFGDTPLHYSLRNEQYEITQYILMILSTASSLKSIVNIQNSGRKVNFTLILFVYIE